MATPRAEIAQRRSAATAQMLEARGLLNAGMTAASITSDANLLDEDIDRWDGLDSGEETAYMEALEAYVEVCANARCEKRFTHAWQRHEMAPFAEALMELVATYRAATHTSAPPITSNSSISFQMSPTPGPSFDAQSVPSPHHRDPTKVRLLVFMVHHL